ncbi:MAG: methyl-accepting chemotaxis protein [Parashewanella sp.]
MTGIFSFGVRLFNRLCFKKKFVILASVTLLPLIIGACSFIYLQIQQVTTTEKKLLGKQYLDVLINIENQVIRARGSGLTLPKTSLLKELQKLELSDYPRSSIQLSELTALADKTSDSEKHLDRFDDLVLALKENIASESGLSLDSNPVYFYLAELYSLRLSLVTEFTSRDSKLAKDILTAGRFTPESYTQIVATNKRLAELTTLLMKNTDQLSHYLNKEDEWLRAVQRVNQLTQSLITTINGKIIEPDDFEIQLNDFVAMSAAQSKSLQQLQSISGVLLDGLLTEKIEGQESDVLMLIIMMCLIVIISLYFFISAYKAISNNVAEINRVTSMIAQGDLTQDIKLNSTDEFGQISTALNQMLLSMRNLIAEVQKLSQEVVSASNQVHVVTKEVESNLHIQQQDTYQVASAISQLVTSVNTVEGNTQQATELTVTAQTDVEHGQSVIEDTVEAINLIAKEVDLGAAAINQLAQHADDIGKVVDVIHGIAEQTNLLALNAAIEAARAGEQGRGFAVVADEVRTLASRTASSTDEIRRMIELVQTATTKAVTTMESGTQKANTGVEQAQAVNSTISNVTKRVIDVAMLSKQIADIVTEQRLATSQVDSKTHAIELGAKEALVAAQTASKIGKELADDAQQLALQISDFKI